MSDMMSTAMIIDTGASLHLENYTGEDGYKGLRCPSSTNISTAGMTERSPVDFEGRHVQYVLGDAPGYEVIQLERPNVAMRSDFRKALWSPSVAFKESGIESYFNARPHLKLPDGRRIPVLEVDYVYALPRWTSSAHAERARSVLLQDKALYACLRAWLDPPARPWASYLDQPVEVPPRLRQHPHSDPSTAALLLTSDHQHCAFPPSIPRPAVQDPKIAILEAQIAQLTTLMHAQYAAAVQPKEGLCAVIARCLRF